MAEAHAAEAEIATLGPRTPLHGIPVGLKDIIDLAGHPTTCHSKLRIDRVATEDAVVTARLRAAGGVFPPQLPTHEIALCGAGLPPPPPPPPPPPEPQHNPRGP